MTDHMPAPDQAVVGGSSQPTVPAPARRGAFPSPTLRQYEVLIAKVQYGGEVATAQAMGLSRHTVKIQLRALRDYWGAHNTTHLAALVFKHVGDIFVVAVVVGFVWWMA